MEWTLSTHLLVYQEFDHHAWQALSDRPWKGLEVWLAEPHVPWTQPQALEAFARRLHDHGLHVASVHLPFYPSVPALLDHGARWSLIDPDPIGRQQALRGAADGLHAAAALGARHAVLHLGWQCDPWSDHSHGWAREGVAALLAIAADAGVTLLLENIISSGTRCAALVDLLNEVDPGRQAGICLDLGHAHLDGGVLAELNDAGERLQHLHVHDNDGCSDQHLAPGLGNLPWPALFEALQHRHYRGTGALEIRDTSRGDTPAAVMLTEQQRCWANFHNLHRNAFPSLLSS